MKTTATCPACQRFEVLAPLWFSTLPALCSSCAESHVLDAELIRETDQNRPTGVELAIAAFDAAQQARAGELGLSSADDYPANYCGPV